MRSQLSVWCVQAVAVSGCGVGDYTLCLKKGPNFETV